MHRHHRAGRRLLDGRPEDLLLRAGHRHARRSRACRWTTVRIARPRKPDGPDGEVMLDIEVAAPSRPRRRSSSISPQHRPGVPGRDHEGHPRHGEQALGDLDQLGRPRVELDRPGHAAVRPGLPGGRRHGDHHLRRRRRQRVVTTESATASPTSISPRRARTSWPAAGPRSTPARRRSAARSSGTTAPTEVPPAAG